MTRRIFIFLSAMSVVLYLTTSVLWARSYSAVEAVTFLRYDKASTTRSSDHDRRVYCRRIQLTHGHLQYVVRRYRQSQTGRLGESNPPIVRWELDYKTILAPLQATPL